MFQCTQQGKEMKTTKCYTLEPHQIATIKAVAKDHGNGSDAAALRYIIDQYVKLTWDAAQPPRPAPQAQETEGESDG